MAKRLWYVCNPCLASNAAQPLDHLLALFFYLFHIFVFDLTDNASCDIFYSMLFDYLTLSSPFSAHTAVSPSILYEAEITGSQKSAFFANKYELHVHRNQLSFATKTDLAQAKA